jgi:hypothetical protein
MCGQVHYVNPFTGNVLGSNEGGGRDKLTGRMSG